MESLRDRLRAIPFNQAPYWHVERSPEDPHELFVSWLDDAIDRGASVPHAVTLSTVDEDGSPDARVVVLKDVTPQFELGMATGTESVKGRQLSRDPRCALTFYWPSVARSVRIRGAAHQGSQAEAAADFRARHPDARALALTGRQSTPMRDATEHERMIRVERARIDADPGLVSPAWAVWWVVPEQVEFWQGAESRDHLRVRYLRDGDSWRHERLWP
jgi:pyridoxamine 5'-phosphate oxidase